MIGSNEETLPANDTARIRGWICCVASILAAVSYSWVALEAYRAQRLADSPDGSFLGKAIALVPANASYHDLLCRRNMFISQDFERAVIECRRASELNPYDSSIWLDLAQAYYSTANEQLSQAAIQKALIVDPTTPNTAWNAANFFLLQGNISEAMEQYAIVLREDPSLAPVVLNTYWQSLHDLDGIRGILPPEPTIYLELLRLLLSTGDFRSAGQIWSELMQLKTTFDFRKALFYIDVLLQAQDVTRASEAWKDLASRSKELQAYFEPNNLVTDASFAHQILNSGFDWRYTPKPQAAVTLDTSIYHVGDRSLKIVYSQSNSDAGISQYIAVRPDSRYRVTAWVSSEDIESANGPALTVRDAYDHTVYGVTEETLGTTPWHCVVAEFRSGHNTSLLLLALERHPGETLIQGRFWIGDIRIVALSAQEPEC